MKPKKLKNLQILTLALIILGIILTFNINIFIGSFMVLVFLICIVLSLGISDSEVMWDENDINFCLLLWKNYQLIRYTSKHGFNLDYYLYKGEQVFIRKGIILKKIYHIKKGNDDIEYCLYSYEDRLKRLLPDTVYVGETDEIKEMKRKDKINKI